jgi:hypothetical protein
MAYNKQLTELAIATLNETAAYLEWLMNAQEHKSGNGKDSILDCKTHVATTDPDCAFYPEAAAETYALSYALHTMREDMQDVADILYGTARHFNVFDGKTGKWFHEDNPTAERHFMKKREEQKAF